MAPDQPEDIAKSIVMDLQPQLKAILGRVDLNATNEAFLLSMVSITQQQASQDSVERLPKIPVQWSSSLAEQVAWQTQLITSVAKLFGVGFVLAMNETIKSKLPEKQRTGLLYDVAMNLYLDVWVLIDKALDEDGGSALQIDKLVPAICLSARLLTQRGISQRNEQNEAGPSTPDTKKVNENQSASLKPPNLKAFWQDFIEFLNPFWVSWIEKSKQTHRTYPSGWLPVAILGPIIYLTWANTFLPSGYAQSVYLIPTLGFTYYLIAPLLKMGFFQLSLPRLALVALLSALTTSCHEVPSGIWAILWAGLTGYILLVEIRDYGLWQQQKCLDEAKEAKAEKSNPNRMYPLLGVDPIALHVGSTLVTMADPDQGDQIFPRIVALRENLTDELGYILPNVRTMDNASIDPNEYLLIIRHREVNRGLVYPGYYMVDLHRFKMENLAIPPHGIVAQHPDLKNDRQVLWLKKEDLPIPLLKEAHEASDVLMQVLRLCAIRSCERIVTLMDVRKSLQLVQDSFGSEHLASLVPGRLSLHDLQRIITNLIREKAYTKDILLFFERISDLSRFENRADLLSEKMRATFKHEICTQLADEHKRILVLELSSEWEVTLLQHRQATDYGWEINLDGQTKNKLIEQLRSSLNNMQVQHGKIPALLCVSSLRLPLFRLLEEDFPDLQLLADNELAWGFSLRRTVAQ